MGFFDKIADKLDDVTYETKRSLKKARKKNDVNSNFDLAAKIVGDTLEKAADVAGKAGKVAYEQMKNMNEEMQEIYAEYSDYDDRRLLDIYKNRSGLRKAMAGKILGERNSSGR